MLKFKISDLLGKYKKNQAWLSSETGIRPTTISNFYYERVKRIETEHLDLIIKAFRKLDPGIGLTDVIEFIDDPENNE